MRCEYIDLYQIHWPSRDCPPCHAHLRARREEPDDEVVRPRTPEDFDRAVLSIKRLFDLGLIKHWGLNENVRDHDAVLRVRAPRVPVTRLVPE